MAQHNKTFYPYDPLPAQDLNDIVGFMNGIATGVNMEPGSVGPDTLAQSAVIPEKLNLGGLTDSGSGDISSTSYVNLSNSATVTINVPASGVVLVLLSGFNYSATNGAFLDTQVNVTGANVLTVANNTTRQAGGENNQRLNCGGHAFLTGLSEGSTTFTVQGKVSGGTGSWNSVLLTVIPLG